MAQQLARDEAGNLFDITDPNNPVPVSQASASPSYIPPSPARQAQDARAANAEDTRLGLAVNADARSATNDAARLDLERQRLLLQQQEAADKREKGGDTTGATAKVRADAIAGYKAGEDLDRLIADLEVKFKAGPGSTSGLVGAIADRIPYQENVLFDDAGKAVRGQVGTALAFTGGQLNTPAEAAAAIGPYLPQSSDRDAAILAKIERLKGLSRLAKERAVAQLGGVPDNNGRITPLAPGQAYNGSITTGATKEQRNPEVERLATSLIRGGLPYEQVNTILRQNGASGDIDRQQFDTMRQAIAKGYRGPTADTAQEVPTTALNRAAGSGVGTGIYSAIDASMGGMSDEVASMLGGGDLADLNARKQAAFAQNPGAALTGQIAGGLGAAVGLGKFAGAIPGVRSLANPMLATDLAFGAASGAGQANDDRLTGGAVGAIGGMVGNVAGAGIASGVGALARTRPGIGAVNATRDLISRAPVGPTLPPIAGANAPTVAQRSLLAALEKSRVPDVTGKLTEAQSLNVPFSLADSSAELRELAGAAVRRSPAASQVAEGALIPRNRGQFDRLGAAVRRDLGPTSNIPQLSEDLIRQARTAAKPLYETGFAAPGASSVELGDIASRPSFQAGLMRAHRIAREEGRDPTALGFDLNEAGEVTLTRVPSFETLDLVKRGLDDTLEPYRNAITGKLDVNEDTRGINATKNLLLSRMDAVNPDYKAARAAYAGPVQARDALARGQDAYSLQPDELGMQVKAQTPEHLNQMRLGYQARLMDHAASVRDASNPFETTLGAPAARTRLETLYSGNPGVPRLLRTRDLEGQAQQTTNAVLGNSKTAQRGIADKAFEGGGVVPMLADGAAMAMGGVPLATVGSRLSGQGMKDAWQFGMGKRAVAKADELAPMLVNPNPAAALASVQDLLAQDAAYKAFVEATTPKRASRFFGRAIGIQTGINEAR